MATAARETALICKLKESFSYHEQQRYLRANSFLCKLYPTLVITLYPTLVITLYYMSFHVRGWTVVFSTQSNFYVAVNCFLAVGDSCV